MNADPLPAAVVLAVVNTKTTRDVAVRCPFCGKTHHHGWPYDDPEGPGVRLSHCHPGPHRSYRLELP